MKKLFSFLVIGMFLSIPFIANAAPLGTGQLNVSWSSPTTGGSPNYYADYDGTVVSSDFGYTTNLEEIFCVSNDHANAEENVDFYTIAPELSRFFSGLYERLAPAAWIADNWTSYGTSDTIKGEAQKAVWKHVGVTFGGDFSEIAAMIFMLTHQVISTTLQIIGITHIVQEVEPVLIIKTTLRQLPQFPNPQQCSF